MSKKFLEDTPDPFNLGRDVDFYSTKKLAKYIAAGTYGIQLTKWQRRAVLLVEEKNMFGPTMINRRRK